jgi:hypothetical protein
MYFMNVKNANNHRKHLGRQMKHTIKILFLEHILKITNYCGKVLVLVVESVVVLSHSKPSSSKPVTSYRPLTTS